MWRRRGRENPREVPDRDEFNYDMEMQPFSSTTPPFLYDGDVVVLMWRNHSEAEDCVTSEGLK